jgi:aryl-alcohol dehydrogenase-like predicted oxidoreductase
MECIRFGNSGLQVSRACLGTMTFGEEWGWGAPPEECRRMLDAYAEAGGNFLDTSGNYNGGSSETILGGLLAGRRDAFVLASKYSLTRASADPNGGGNHRKNLRLSVEESLRRLRTDHLDILWMHVWDGLTPAEEVIRGLDDLAAAGKILYAGVSDTPAWAAARMHAMALARDRLACEAIQVRHSLLDRTAERELLPMAAALGLSVLAWGCLGEGLLSGKYAGQAEGRTSRGAPLRPDARRDRILEALAAVARETGRGPAATALAWSLAHGVIPILGARSLAQLKENLACLEVRLDAGQLARLDAASAIDPGFPHDFLAQDNVRRALHGEAGARLDYG